MKFTRHGIQTEYFSWSLMAWWLCALVATWYLYGIRLNNENWKTVVGSDGGGYYAYLPAVFVHHDYDYKFASKAESYHYFQNPNPAYYCNIVDGDLVNKYYAGVSVCLLPFFLPAAEISTWFDYPLDGYSFLYQASVAFGAVVYLLLGLWYVRKILKHYGVPDHISAITILLLYFATNLMHYANEEPSMSHVYSFAVIAVFAWTAIRLFADYSRRRLAWLAFLLGLITIIRPSNVFVVFLLPFLAGSKEQFFSFFKKYFRDIYGIVFSVLAFGSMVFVQLLMYKLQLNRWFVYSYSNEGLNFLKPELLNILFSWRKGFFIYTPLMLVAMTGFVFWGKRKDWYSLVTLLGGLFVVIYVISCWSSWPYGGSYGMRPIVDLYAFFAIPLALFLQFHARWWQWLLSGSLLAFLCFVNLVQMYQYHTGILPYDEMTYQKYKRIFLKTGSQFQYMYYPGSDVIPRPPVSAIPIGTPVLFDYEKIPAGQQWPSVVANEKFTSGIHAMRLDNKNRDGIRHSVLMNTVIPDSLIGKCWMKVKGNFWLDDDGTDASLIICFIHLGNAYFWNGYPIIHQIDKEKSWQKFEMSVKIPVPQNPADEASAFIIKRDGTLVYVDDFEMSFWYER